MKKAIVLTLAFIIVGALLAGCGTPPPLKSDKYLNDTSLITQQPCGAPCFHDITVGQTTFTDALSKLRADSAFANIQSQDNPKAANWAAQGGDTCCQLSADQNTGIVNGLLLKVAPKMTAQQVVDKYGEPKYVSTVDYTDKEVAVALIFPEKGLVVWTSPGDANSSLQASSPVVLVVFLDPKDWDKVLDTATLQGWNGFQPYNTYKSATPVVTPRVTATPQ